MSRRQSFEVCFCFSRIFKYREIDPPEDVIWLFRKYSENATMSLHQLQRFLIEFQKERQATQDDAQAIFSSLKHLKIFQRRGLRVEDFFRYLLSDLNLAFSPSQVHQDMDAPLAHYFLYTGHNSYLTGNQLSSDSSVVPIIKALVRGVRVIELDLWPDSSGNNVNVCHGGTLTKPVKLIECFRAIKEHAFSASEFPLVLTFEDHLTPDLQARVAKMVNNTFGELLFYPESDYLREFPSPKSLKNKIIISTKPPKEYLETESMKKEDEPLEQETISANKEVIDNMVHEEQGEGDADEDVLKASPVEYRHLIAIHAGKPKGGIKQWLRIDSDKVRRLSLSEQELENVVDSFATDTVRFTQRNLLRVYPKGTRFNSSNYNPFVGWMHGAQMVAFNMQGYGKHLWIMHGMFRANGGCGYVKKPQFLLPGIEVFDPKTNLPVKKVLRVKVFMGEGWRSDFGHTHFDRFSPPDFFTRVGIAGVPADSRMERTSVIEDQWEPVWDEEFEFQLTVPELALLRVEVLEYDTSGLHDFGGQTCLPLPELREGIRAVPLHNRKGERYKSVRLLMSFEIISQP